METKEIPKVLILTMIIYINLVFLESMSDFILTLTIEFSVKSCINSEIPRWWQKISVKKSLGGRGPRGLWMNPYINKLLRKMIITISRLTMISLIKTKRDPIYLKWKCMILCKDIHQIGRTYLFKSLIKCWRTLDFLKYMRILNAYEIVKFQ